MNQQVHQEVPTTFIQDPSLAEAMAYGEKPHMEAAQEAWKHGKFQEVAGHLAVAEAASAEAGKIFIDDEQTRIDSLRSQVNGDIRPSERAKTEIMLTPEQQEKADKTKESLIKKFDLDPEDVSVLMVETKDGKKPVVMYAAGNGIYKGSWNAIFDEKADKNFIIEVDGQQVDARKGMTRAAYDALIEDARNRGVTLPDSKPLSQENDQPWTVTLLTGEGADQDRAPVAGVNVGQVRQDWDSQDIDYQFIRFRPAVVIE